MKKNLLYAIYVEVRWLQKLTVGGLLVPRSAIYRVIIIWLEKKADAITDELNKKRDATKNEK